MDHLDEGCEGERGEDGENRKATLEDRKHGFQPAEELGRGHNARLQPQCKRAEEPLPDAADIRLR